MMGEMYRNLGMCMFLSRLESLQACVPCEGQGRGVRTDFSEAVGSSSGFRENYIVVTAELRRSGTSEVLKLGFPRLGLLGLAAYGSMPTVSLVDRALTCPGRCCHEE